jgi:hypothetical protein
MCRAERRMNSERSNTHDSSPGTPSEPPASQPPTDPTGESVSVEPRSGSEPPPKRQSSIRPAPPDWHPPSQRRVPSPMVVVYSGDSGRPPPRWDAAAQPSERRTQIDFDLPRDPTTPHDVMPASNQILGNPGGAGPGNADGVAAISSRSPATGRNESGWPTAADIEEAPYSTAATAHSRARRALWPLVGLGAVAVGIAVFALPNHPDSVSTPVSAAQHASEARPLVAESRDAPRQQPVVATPAPAPPAQAASAPATPAAAEDVPLAERVTVEVFPEDAKVLRRGQRIEGPPYSVEIPKGKRIAVEVTSPGYVTRRVVLDGSEPAVMIGLFRNTGKHRDPRRPTRQTQPASMVKSGL